MKILNELVELAYKANAAGQGTPEMVEFRVAANPDNILVIAEEFRALEKQRDALAAENAALKSAADIIKALNAQPEEARFCGFEDWQIDKAVDAMTAPATAAYLNSVRAEGVELAAKFLTEANTVGSTGAMGFALHNLADQLRAGNAGKDGVKKTITALPVERDEHGYWSHPDYLAFCDGREFIPAAEFDQWMSEHGLQWKVEYRDEEEIDPNVDGYDLSTWTPKAPAGDGWFVGSIHDTEDGAVCIWLRAGKDGE